jgi:TolB-like protein
VPAKVGRPPAAPSQPEDNASGKRVPVFDASRQSAALKRRTPWPWSRIGIGAAVLAIVATPAWWLVRPKPGPNTIAVLPFKNLSSEPGSDYFSDGLTDEVIRNLSIIDGLQVKSRTSSFAFKDRPRNMHEVGAQLGANLVVEGSVLRSGDKLRINVQLVRVSDDFPLWSGRFDRELKDVFAIQDEISRSIVNELRLKLGGQRRYNTSPDNYDVYLKARELANQIMPGPGQREAGLKAIASFEQVIAKDPDFAPAYAEVADVCLRLAGLPRATFEGADEKGRAAAEKGMQLDPLLAEAHGDMGLFYAGELAWNDAERSFRRAIQLNPNLSRVREEFANFVLLPLGKLEEAVQQARKGVELDPLSPDRRSGLGFVLSVAGRNDEALDNARCVLAVRDDLGARLDYGMALVRKGRLDEAIAIFEKLGPGFHGFLGYAYAKMGRRAEAEQLAAENDVAAARHQAWIYAGLGDKDRALDALQRMAAMKDPIVDVYPYFPEFALLRGDPRLNEFRRKRGLPPVH